MSNSTKSLLADDANYSEWELDANRALNGIGQRSNMSKLVNRVKKLFAFSGLTTGFLPNSHPSVFLHLSDVFRVGSNFLRLCVLKVTQQSKKHMEKILN